MSVRYGRLSALLAMIVMVVIGVALVRRAVLSHNPETTIPTAAISTAAVPQGHTGDYSAAEQTLKDKLEERLNRPLTLTFKDKSWTFSPATIGATLDAEKTLQAIPNYVRDAGDTSDYDALVALTAQSSDYEIALTYDSEAVTAFADKVKTELDVAPVDSTLKVARKNKFEFSQSSVGYSLDAEALKDALVSAIQTGQTGTMELQPEEIVPAQSEEDLAKSVQLLAKFPTSYAGSIPNRVSNISLALSMFNGLVVEDGESVSFNGVVGQRKLEYGFKKAPEYNKGSVVEGVGGGVCQASTTVYGAVLRAGLQILERNSHSMTVGYVLPSQDAAVTDTNKDLRFKNTTGNVIYIFTEINKSKKQAIVSIYGTVKDPNVKIDIESLVTEKDIKSPDRNIIKDLTGDTVWYKDDEVLVSTGKTGVKSRAYRKYIDKTTGEVVKSEMLSNDYYEPQKDTYMVGVHDFDDAPIATP